MPDYNEIFRKLAEDGFQNLSGFQQAHVNRFSNNVCKRERSSSEPLSPAQLAVKVAQFDVLMSSYAESGLYPKNLNKQQDSELTERIQAIGFSSSPK